METLTCDRSTVRLGSPRRSHLVRSHVFGNEGGKQLPQKLAGKIAVITGGSSGIGFATAKRFVDEGAYVFITGRRKGELDEAVNQIGRNVTGVQSDVSKAADVDKLYAAVKEQKGEIDIVFANAGIGEFAPLAQITEDHFDKQFNVNVKGLLFTVQKALPLMKPGGSIVLNASIVSITGSPALSVYSATKAAVRSFARTWCVDLKERQIRVNAISPGIVPTPGYNTSLGMTQEQVDQYVQDSLGNIPLGRPGTTDEIAKAVSFLASDDSSYVNGIELFIDGGLAQI
ncbi:MAG: glucose 1-dehydrogenase [Bryobacteraceae bacterium]|nr:glucose 1-dehydrogenase [Bryobacteraceae bacterium]